MKTARTGAVRYVQCQIYASRNLVFTSVNLVSSGVNSIISSGNIKSKGAAHRAAPLADSSTSCSKSTESKKARPLNSKMANADTLNGAGVNSGNALDAAKVQQNSEITKDLAKKYCLLLHHSALIAGASARQLRRIESRFQVVIGFRLRPTQTC